MFRSFLVRGDISFKKGRPDAFFKIVIRMRSPRSCLAAESVEATVLGVLPFVFHPVHAMLRFYSNRVVSLVSILQFSCYPLKR